MFEIIIVSIGLVLVIEGIIYFILADKIEKLIAILRDLSKQKIKKISLSMVLIGLCLILFIFRFYGEIK